MRKTTILIVATLILLLLDDDAFARRRVAYLHGTAAVIRARGRAERNVSRARINNEEARSRYIDNQLKWTETYFAKKAITDAHRAKENAKQREALQDYLKHRPSGAPPRLSLSEFDPSSGEIIWPDGLQTAEFGPSRKQVESLFTLRANALAAPGIVTDIRKAVETMRAELRKIQGKPNEAKRIWPIVQLSDWGERVAIEQVDAVLGYGSQQPATGVMAFHWNGLAKEWDKVQALKRAYTNFRPA